MKKKSANLFSTIGAVCLILYVIFGVCVAFQEFEIFSVPSRPFFDKFITIILAVLLLMHKKNIALLIVAITDTLLHSYICPSNFFFCIEFAVILILILFVLIFVFISFLTQQTKRQKKKIKLLWFFPSVLILVQYFIKWLYLCSAPNYMVHLFDNHPIYLIISIVADCLLITAYTFMGLWLYKNPKRIVKKQKNLQKDNHKDQHISIGDADKLNLYKDLLDSGAITQEEFDSKKKKLLGL